MFETFQKNIFSSVNHQDNLCAQKDKKNYANFLWKLLIFLNFGSLRMSTDNSKFLPIFKHTQNENLHKHIHSRKESEENLLINYS